MNFSNLHILVVGDIMLDEFNYGTTTRQSPEFDAPVVKIDTSTCRLGGAGNVVANLIGLGARASIVSVIGEDYHGERIKGLLAQLNCDAGNIVSTSERQTTFKSRLYSDNVPIARIDHEDDTDITPETEEKILSHIDNLLNDHEYDGIIIQDYNKGLLTKVITEQLIEKARMHKIPSFVDPKIKNYQHYNGCHYLKPNINEISHILGYRPVSTKEALNEAAFKLRQYVEHDTLVITLSEKGAYFSDGINSEVVSTNTIDGADVCGAGDSFISAFALAACVSDNISESIEFANRVSAVACMHAGVHAVNIDEIST